MRTLSVIFFFAFVHSCISAQAPPVTWCLDKPLTRQDTLALIANRVHRVRIYEANKNDSSRTIPKSISGSGKDANPL
ncbi:MAG TPA: hypothetical protein VI112_05080, partial [Bacteroidia bacterium]